MATAMLNKAARGNVLGALRCFDEATVEAAMAYVPEDYHPWARDSLRKSSSARWRSAISSVRSRVRSRTRRSS